MTLATITKRKAAIKREIVRLNKRLAELDLREVEEINRQRRTDESK